MTNLTLTILCIITFVTAWRLTGLLFKRKWVMYHEINLKDGTNIKFYEQKWWWEK